MRRVSICDTTMKRVGDGRGPVLTFKEKLELVKLLDRLGVDVIEVEGLTQINIDTLRIKSMAASVTNSVLAVPAGLDEAAADAAWNAVKLAKRPRLQVEAPVSPVQMEYMLHKKPAALLEAIRSTVARCKEYTQDVEFAALDATRSDSAFLYAAVACAIEAGASTVSVYDTAGAMLPYEFGAFVSALYENVPSLSSVRLAVGCSDALAMAEACAMEALRLGAGEIKAAAYGSQGVSVENMAGIINAKGETLKAGCNVAFTQLKRIIAQITWMFETGRSKNSPFENGIQSAETVMLGSHDDKDAVIDTARRLGYDLSDEDGARVWEAFERIAAKKEKVSSKELDAIIAAAAMQVPPTYKVESYVVNTGNIISSMAHMKLRRNGKLLEGMSVGDGPIDAAFLAIEQITGRHYELDDFEIQAVTQGREAMGETVVKLRSNGKLYPGRGISTDIVESGIRAYLNALNRIAYEEAEQ